MHGNLSVLEKDKVGGALINEKKANDVDLDFISSTIEEVRKKLYISMNNNSNSSYSSETQRVSGKLDRLIVEFLQFEEKLDKKSF